MSHRMTVGYERAQMLSQAHEEDSRARGEKISKALELHRPVDIEPSETICGECSFQLPNGKYFGKIVEHPCATVAILSGGA